MIRKVSTFIVMLAILVPGISGAASAVTVTTLPLTGSPIEISISGHRVVYIDEVTHGNNFVRVYDVGTGIITSINATGNERSYITIDGSRIIWYESGGAGLYLYDMNAPVPGGSSIADSGLYSFNPALAGTVLAWIAVDFSGPGESSLWFQNLGSPSVQVAGWVTLDGTGPPDVSGNYIVWHDDHGTHEVYDVFYYDVTNPIFRGTAITSVLADQMYPRISGNNIVYCDGFTNSQDIYLYTLPGGPELKITDGSNKGWYPDISGNYIVWESGGQIYMYNIADGSTTQLTSGPDQYTKPRIDGNHIVWLESVGEGATATAYLATIQDETTTLPYTGK